MGAAARDPGGVEFRDVKPAISRSVLAALASRIRDAVLLGMVVSEYKSHTKNLLTKP